MPRAFPIQILLLPCLLFGCSRADRSKESKAAVDVGAPPMPTFDTPVDYMAWHLKRLGTEDAPCAEDVYAPIYREDVKSVFEPERDLLEKLKTATTKPWSPDSSPDLAEYITGLDHCLYAYHRGSQTPDVRWLCKSDTLWAGPHIEFKPSRVLSKAVLARAWMNTSELKVDGTRLLDAIRTNFRHAAHRENAGYTIAFLVANAIRADTYEAIQHGLATGVLRGDDARDVLSLLDAVGNPDALADALRGDWAGLLEMVQTLYPNGRFSDAAAKALAVDKYLPSGGVFLPAPAKTAARINEWCRPIAQAATKPLSVSRYRSLLAHGRERGEFAGRNTILSLYLPSHLSAYSAAMRVEIRRRGTALMAAIHIYKEDHGRWPKATQDLSLSPEKLRIDLFRGNAFVFELREGQPWLYSVGLDGEDNGGNHDPRACRSERFSGTDFVFLPIQEDAKRRAPDGGLSNP